MNHNTTIAKQLITKAAFAKVIVMLLLNGVSPEFEIFDKTIGVIPEATIQTDSINEEAAENIPTKAVEPKKYQLNLFTITWK